MGRVGGTVSLTIEGQPLLAKGSFTGNIGAPTREVMKGDSQIHGFTEVAGTPMLEGVATVDDVTDWAGIVNIRDATVVYEAGSGQTLVFSNAWYAGDGNWTSEAGELVIKFQARECKII